MKLIISELEALKRFVSREFFYVMTELMTRYGWRQVDTWELWQAPGSLRNKLIDRFGELPQSILFWEGYEFLNAHAREIIRLDCAKTILADDLHCHTEKMLRMNTVGFALCDTVLSTYGYAWSEYYPNFWRGKKVVWVPHAASPDFMIEYNHSPEDKVLLSGAINHQYPLREQLIRLHSQGSKLISYQAHPGYHCAYDYATDGNVGRGYAMRLNRHRVGFTDCLKYRYVVAKHFEIPATGALLLADGAVSGPLKQLGFVENRHYISTSSETLEEKLSYVLAEGNRESIDEIRRRGQELVWERHKTSDRARQINEVCS